MIPRTLHQVWVGGPLPAHLAEYRRALVAMHPRWRHVLWDDDAVARRPLRNAALYEAADRIAGRSAGQLRGDIVRLEVLAEFGGVYVDVDCEPVRPLDPLLDLGCFLGWEVPDVWANNAVIGATRAHPFVEACIEGLAANVRRHPGKRPNVLSGPQYVTPLAREHHVTILPAHYFYPYLHDELDRDGGDYSSSYLVHHWDNARKRKGAPRVHTATA